MANTLYAAGLEGLLDRTIDLTGDIRVALVRSTYTPSADFDVTLDDLGGAINGRSAALTGMSYTAGTFDADDTSLVAETSEPCNALALFQHDADDSSARLIAYIDDPAVGLPFTPAAGQTVDILWDDGADHIFTIKRSTT